MVAGKQQQHASTTASSSNNNNSAYEIRSGMSVQDLKQLTAQRAHRQRMEYWDLHASSSSSSSSSSRGSTHSPRRQTSDWAFGSPVSSSTSSSSGGSTGSPSDSPPRQYSKNNMYAYPNYAAAQHHYHNNHHHHHHTRAGALSNSASDKMFVTCGGQVVSFMEGVVNAPQFDFLPEMLNTL